MDIGSTMRQLGYPQVPPAARGANRATAQRCREMKSSALPHTAFAGDDGMRVRILRAAFRAFTENGYAGTSTLQIATQAKVSKRDLYAIFPNKQAMLVACIKTRLERMRM